MDPETPRQPLPVEDLRRAKRHAKTLLATVDGVGGVGIGDGTIRVYVRDSAVTGHLPTEIDGVPIESVVVGEVTTY